ncbi:MAG TPA: hypothetical protein VGK48_28760 [Terriglobia bacterium]|jgi:hypothetical protein
MRIKVAILLLVLGIVAGSPSQIRFVQAAPVQQAALPGRLSDAEFWNLASSLSEPGGYFRIVDNFTSNESEVGRLFPRVAALGGPGGVYLGVGPEQNLSYIAALRPAMAFIVDIRRQAAIQHLMFKAVFELSKDRADFISMLFAKPKPADIEPMAPIQQIWGAFANVPTDKSLAAKNHAAVVDRLKTHGFTLTEDESSQLDLVLNAFVQYGPAITTNSGGGGGGRGGNGASFEDLTGWETDDGGQPRSFLSTDENYRFVKTLQEKNLLIPVTGDFGGPKALRAVGKYLHEHNGIVRAFYVSNVESYLFMDGKSETFYENVASLPLNDLSVFIRPYAMRQAGRPEPLCGIVKFLAAAQAGRVRTNNDALSCPQ